MENNFGWEEKCRNRKDTCFDFGYFQILFPKQFMIHESRRLYKYSSIFFILEYFHNVLHTIRNCNTLFVHTMLSLDYKMFA